MTPVPPHVGHVVVSDVGSDILHGFLIFSLTRRRPRLARLDDAGEETKALAQGYHVARQIGGQPSLFDYLFFKLSARERRKQVGRI